MLNQWILNSGDCKALWHMITTESISSNDRAQMEAWLAELKLSPQLGENAIEILRAWKNQFKYNPHSGGRFNYRSLLAASLYAAIKADPLCAGIALHDLLIVTKTSKVDVSRRYREMVLDVEVTPQACSMKPGPYLDMLLTKVNADEKFKQRALEILYEVMNKTGGNGIKSPVTTAGVVLYAASLESNSGKIPQRTVAEMIGVTEPTIRRYYLHMKSILPESYGACKH
jgi:transcription initiation factor TFIIIB Brf1 subunit/transcription initiation factor TFIIB